jgi:hypothetical protein
MNLNRHGTEKGRFKRILVDFRHFGRKSDICDHSQKKCDHKTAKPAHGVIRSSDFRGSVQNLKRRHEKAGREGPADPVLV